jgi:hypothetical protein
MVDRHTLTTIMAFHTAFLDMLTADVDGDRLVLQPPSAPNHPLWQIGHICVAAAGAAKLLGARPSLPDDFSEKFGRGSEPQPDASLYPDLKQMLAVSRTIHGETREALLAASDETLNLPNPNEKLREGLPTVGDMVAFLVSSHEALHLGQLTSWRRAVGLPAVL